MSSRYNDVKEALNLALIILGRDEPSDSRAVSNEYVAMISAGTGGHNDECRQIIRNAISRLDAQDRENL